MKKKVAVLFGGRSTEHEVSRISAYSIIKHIDKELFDVIMIGVTTVSYTHLRAHET